ncbi:MAG: HlyD family efflux transporter periplasmic adaptor subunit [Ferruginibacter sp.]
MINTLITNNSIIYKSEISSKQISLYWFILLMLTCGIASLPLIKLDISVKSAGIIRPVDEKTDIRSSVSTVIDTIYFKEGDTVQKGDIIIQLRKENLAIKKTRNDFEMNQREKFIADLSILTRHSGFSTAITANMQSPVYKQESSRFTFQLSELTSQLKKVQKELYIDSVLSADNVISPKEMFDKQIEHEKLISNIQATREQQIATWQQQLANYKLEKSQFENANRQLREDDNFYSIKAPISGVLQNFNKYYQGSVVQAGEILAVISPQAALIAECYINTRDIGLLKTGQPTLFQIDAFDYNYFGVLTGKIISIDNDYTIIDNRPAFKVRCFLDGRQLSLKNGFTGNIKKGMTLQARFIVTRRSLWQLLFDKISDWINPVAR